MYKKYLPFTINLESKYSNLKKIFSVEGGVYFFATRKDKFYVIEDYGTMSDFLKVGDKELGKLKTEYEFDNKIECREFINKLNRGYKNEENNFRIPKELL